jgi:hypothetical protein
VKREFRNLPGSRLSGLEEVTDNPTLQALRRITSDCPQSSPNSPTIMLHYLVSQWDTIRQHDHLLWLRVGMF